MGVGIVSTAELFRDPVVGFLRRRMITGDLQSPLHGPYKGGLVKTGTDGKSTGVDPLAGLGEGIPGGFLRQFLPEQSRNPDNVFPVIFPAKYRYRIRKPRIFSGCRGKRKVKTLFPVAQNHANRGIAVGRLPANPPPVYFGTR